MSNNNYYKKDGCITQVYRSGRRVGSEKEWDYGKIQYDASGNRRSFVDKAGNKYNADGSRKY